MPSIVAEWICRVCKGKHRVRYELKTNASAYSKATDVYESNGVKISDPAYLMMQKSPSRDYKTKKYAILANNTTPIWLIINTLKAYLLEFYTTQEKTLIVEICNDGE